MTDRVVPHHFSAKREGMDSVLLSAWNEDGSHVEDIALTNSSALDLIAVVAQALNA